MIECHYLIRYVLQNISTIREKFNKTALKSYNANANRNRKIKMIQTITLKQEPQPSSSSSKILPIPLNIQPRIPPPVKMMSPNTMMPIIVSISICSILRKSPTDCSNQLGTVDVQTFLISHQAWPLASCACLLKPAALIAALILSGSQELSGVSTVSVVPFGMSPNFSFDVILNFVITHFVFSL